MEKNRIFFERPNPALFHSMGLMSIDMHYHSNYSDSYTTVNSILAKAARRKVGVALTDHNEIKGCQRAYNNTRGVMIIPGIEVSCSEGAHILFYFYNINELGEFYEKHVKPYKQGNPYLNTMQSSACIIEASKAYNCIRTSAHPFGYSVSNCGLAKCIKKHYVDETVFDSIDAMEVICGAMPHRLNRKAYTSCMQLTKCFTGGTDGHTIFELGNVLTASYADSIESFLNNIIKKKNYVVGTETKLVPKLLPGTNMISKHMRYGLETVKIKYNMSHKVKSISEKILGINNGKP